MDETEENAESRLSERRQGGQPTLEIRWKRGKWQQMVRCRRVLREEKQVDRESLFSFFREILNPCHTECWLWPG